MDYIELFNFPFANVNDSEFLSLLACNEVSFASRDLITVLLFTSIKSRNRGALQGISVSAFDLSTYLFTYFILYLSSILSYLMFIALLWK